MSGFLNSQLEKTSGSDHTVLSEEKAAGNVRLSAAGITIAAAVIGLFFKDPLQSALGLLLGDVIAQLLFLQNEKSVDRALKDPERAPFISKGSYYIRMLIRGATLVVAYINPYTSLVTTFFGLMTVPAAIYLLAFISNAQLKKQEAKEETDEHSADNGGL